MKSQELFPSTLKEHPWHWRKLKTKLIALITICITTLLLYPFSMLIFRGISQELTQSFESSSERSQTIEEIRHLLDQSMLHYQAYLLLAEEQEREQWKRLWKNQIIPSLDNLEESLQGEVMPVRFGEAKKLTQSFYDQQLKVMEEARSIHSTLSDSVVSTEAIDSFTLEENQASPVAGLLTLQNQLNDTEIQQIRSSLYPLLDQIKEVQRDHLNKSVLTFGKSINVASTIIFSVGLMMLIGVIALSHHMFNSLKSSVPSLSDLLNRLSRGETPSKVPESEDEVGKLIHFSNNVSEHLHKASEFAKAIGRGEFDVNFASKGENDTLGNALLQMQKKLQKIKQKDEDQNYVTQGNAELGAILQGQRQEESKLFQAVIYFLVNYLGANQGALFILDKEHEEEVLRMVSAYAYGRKKHMQKTIAKGEGLIGQAVLEKDIVYITEVPQGYTQITSGLGEATPSCLVIVPMISSDEVYGAFELALFHKLETHQLEMLKQMSENLASNIAAIKTNTRTRRLLEQSQQQAEELRAQEEEMRQNMEEMQATQEEMNRMSTDQQGQLTAINKTLAAVNFTKEGIITGANQNFLKLMGYSEEEVVGQHHRIFVRAEERESEEYRQFWKTLSEGGQLIGDYKRIDKKGSPIWLKGTYTAVKNAEGNVVKVIKFAIDITEQKQLEEAVKEQLAAAQDMRQVLEESQEKMEVLFSSAMDGIIMIDERGTIELFNPAAEKMFLYNAREVIGKNIKMLMPEQYSNHHDGYLDRYKNTKEQHVIGMARSVHGQRKDKTTFPLEIRIEKGMIRERRIFVGILRDLSSQDVELFEDVNDTHPHEQS